MEKESYLILSGEGNHETEHQFVMSCDTLNEAEKEFESLKKTTYSTTYLFIYKAVKLKEE
jgi:hypothetical protein